MPCLYCGQGSHVTGLRHMGPTVVGEGVFRASTSLGGELLGVLRTAARCN